MKFLFLFIFAFTCELSFAQNTNRYGLKVLSLSEYQESLSTDSNNRLVEIKKLIPGIILDIRYAGKNNFTGQAVYDEAMAFARLPVVKALLSVQSDLRKRGLGLKIYDAYRPYAVTLKFFEIASDKNFVADPAKGSRHNRGCAIDLTLVKLKNGKDLKMPTQYDSFAAEAASDYKVLPKRAIRNRNLLIKVMGEHGFTVLNNEWWHFDYNGWSQYELMDIPFKVL